MQAACNWVCAEIKGVILWFVNKLKTMLINATGSIVEWLSGPIVRTPHIEGKNGWIAFEGAANEPWASLWGDFYLKFIMPLALGLLFLGIGFIGLRVGAVQPSEYRRKRLLRRIPIAFFSIFFWWPVASFGTRLVDSMALAIIDGNTLVTTFTDVLNTWVSSVGSLLIILLVAGLDVILLLTAGFLIASRWLLIMLLTVSMPLLAVFWVFEEWPLKRFAGISRNLASLYPGLLIGGVFSAILIRFVYELQLNTTPWGIANGFMKITIISLAFPLAAFVPLLTAFGGSRAVQYAALGAASSGVGAASARTKSAINTTVVKPAKWTGKKAYQGGKYVTVKAADAYL